MTHVPFVSVENYAIVCESGEWSHLEARGCSFSFMGWGSHSFPDKLTSGRPRLFFCGGLLSVFAHSLGKVLVKVTRHPCGCLFGERAPILGDFNG